MNVKGVMQAFNPVFAGIILLLVLAVVIFAVVAKAGGDTGTSLIPKKSGCNAPEIPVQLNGELLVADKDEGLTSPLLRVTPEAQSVSVIFIKANNVPLKGLGIFSQSYDWRVMAIDKTNGNQIASDSGSGKIEEFGKESERFTYDLFFKIPDNNCDGQIDDFLIALKGEAYVNNQVSGNPVTKNVRFSNGRFVLEG